MKLGFIYGFFWWQGITRMQPSLQVQGDCREETCSGKADSRGGCLQGPIADIRSPCNWSWREFKLRVSQGGELRGSYLWAFFTTLLWPSAVG